MTPSTPVIAPPYHVQSTAVTLRSGFPYFAHHGSINALWKQKWRMPCEHGIYPFTDGKLEDFEPIFAELIKISDDNVGLLFRPDQYAEPFLPVAENLVALAEEVEVRGDIEGARGLYLRAAAVYRIARFPINRSSITERAWQAGKAAYVKGGQHLDPPFFPVYMPFTRVDASSGDEDRAIEAYLRIPKGERPVDGWPVLLFICGLDAYKTDNTSRTQIHVDHGFATLLFEIPGTGDCPAAPNDPASPDRLMSSVLDWVSGHSTEYGFDLTRIVARGISTGGYYAMRAAHTHADQLFAVAAQGGGCHFMFDLAWINAQNQMEYPSALADALAYKYGYRGNDAVKHYATEARKFSLLEAGVLDRPNCKLALINGMEDSIFPIEDNFVVGIRGENKDLLFMGNRGHMANPGGEDLVHKWLDQAIVS
jgi:hypothetical protein